MTIIYFFSHKKNHKTGGNHSKINTNKYRVPIFPFTSPSLKMRPKIALITKHLCKMPKVKMRYLGKSFQYLGKYCEGLGKYSRGLHKP